MGWPRAPEGGPGDPKILEPWNPRGRPPDPADGARAQGIVPEGEWEDFMDALRRTLPTTFRINGSGKFAEALRRKLEDNFLADLVQSGLRVRPEPSTEH